MKTIIFASSAALFILGNAVWSQGGVPTRSETTSPVSGQRKVALPLPETYARKFGVGATGANAAGKVLLNRNSSRKQIAEALDAVTYYGHEGAGWLSAFSSMQLRRNQVEHANDTSWYIPIVSAMAKVPDALSVGPLLHWTRYGEDPVLRIKALKVFSALVANAQYEIPTGEGEGQVVHVSGVTADQGWNSLGQSITLENRAAIKTMAQRVLSDVQTPTDVRKAAESLMWFITASEERDQKALDLYHARRNGEAPPDVGGYGGFGTPPAAD